VRESLPQKVFDLNLGMTRDERRLLVIGQGASGLCAAVAAMTSAQNAGLHLSVTLLDAAPKTQSGGNSRWSPSNIRLEADYSVAPDFVEDILASSDGLADRSYFQKLADHSSSMIQWLIDMGVIFQNPPYYLAKGPSRIQPVGGGQAILDVLTAHAKNLGIQFINEFKLTQLISPEKQVIGVIGLNSLGENQTLFADSVILACGGFEGNSEMRKTHLGAPAENFNLISPGTIFNDGAGIQAAIAIGAQVSGDWAAGHSEPIDPRSQGSAPVVLVYPYGLVVNSQGQRFWDEGAGLMHDTWEKFANHIQHQVSEKIVFLILDSKLTDIPNYARAIRSEVPPISASSLEQLAQKLGISSEALISTVSKFNAACLEIHSEFNPSSKDGRACFPEGQPPKSNWSRILDKAPFLAWPLVGALVYTFGGLRTNENTQVLSEQGPIKGLYAAGETTGNFYKIAPNSVSMLRALVFGKISGEQAVADFLS